MENNDNQGNYQQSEQHWACLECETLNTGDCCAVCGCPRPAEKQKPESLQTSEGQGSYEDALPEWICPNCETHNTGNVCIVCGCVHSVKIIKRKSTFLRKAMIAVVACLLILPVAVAVVSRHPHWSYLDAFTLLENGQYQQAYQAFSALGTYQDSEQLASDAAMQWVLQTLDTSDLFSAHKIRDTVSLNAEQSQIVYQKICNTDVYTYSTDSQGYEDSTYHCNDFQVRRLLLDTLDANSCANIPELRDLFSNVSITHLRYSVLNHRDLLETLWHIPVVQNIVRNRFCITEWLYGEWITMDCRYYLKFYANSSGGTDSEYNVPWMSEPPGADYFTIQNLTYSWADKNDEILQDVYRFTLLEPDKIEVYSFLNQKTYTMIRK